MNKQIIITQQRIDELNQQFNLTNNENWQVLKQDLENQLFVLKCKELLKIYKKSDEVWMCFAFTNNPDKDFWEAFIDSLWEFAADFLIQNKIDGFFVGVSIIFAHVSGNTLTVEGKNIRIKFLKYLIKKHEQNIIKTNY